MSSYPVPKNISKPNFTIGPFKVVGIIEGAILALITYLIFGLIPFPYYAVKVVFRWSAVIFVFVFVARGVFDYPLTVYTYYIIKYWLNRDDHKFKKSFRLSLTKTKSLEGSAQGFVIEEELGRDGLIKLKDDRYVAIVEVPPVNFFTKSQAEKENIIDSFERKLRSMPVKAQIVSYASPADPYEFINEIKRQAAKDENKPLKNEYDDYYRLCRACIGRLTLHQHYAVVFSSDALDRTYSTNEERMSALTRCATMFASQMGGSFIQDSNPEKFKAKIGKFLYNVYNPNNIKSDAYDKRKKKVDETFRIMSKRAEEPFNEKQVPVSYYVSPMCFDDKSSTRYLVVGDNYYSFFYIESDTYPINGITEGWISQLPQIEGVDYHLFYEKITDTSYMTKLNRTVNLSNKVLGVQEKESVLKTEVSTLADAAYYLKSRMEQQDVPYYMGVMISIHSNYIQRIYDLEDELQQYMVQNGIVMKSCRYFQKEAYKATLLGNKVPDMLWNKMKQNVPASTLAAMYPFAASRLADQSGAFIGTSTDAAVYLDLFNTLVHANANLGIFAGSGSGKTYFLMALAERMRLNGVEVFIVLPTKGFEWEWFRQNLHGNMIRVNSTTGQTINIMDIFPQKVASEDKSSLLYKKVESIKAFVKFKAQHMTPEEEQILERCILDTYLDYGITEDNETVWADKEHTKPKEMPILGDLSAKLDEYAKRDVAAKSLATIMHTFTTGTLSYFNNRTNADLTKGVTVFDLSDVSANTKTISMFATTELIQSYFEHDRRNLKMIVVDEIWMLLENEGSAEVVIDWAKTIRSKSGSLCFATQELNDLSRARNGQTLCSQANTRVLLGMNNEEAETTKNLLYLTDEMCNKIKGRERGQGIMLMNGDAVEVNILGTGHNTLSYTTEPKLRLVREDLKNKEEWNLVVQLLDGMGKQYDVDRITRELQKHREKKAEEELESRLKESPKEEVVEEQPIQVVEKPTRPQQTPPQIEKPVRTEQPKTNIEKPIRQVTSVTPVASVTQVQIEKPQRQVMPTQIEKPTRQRPTETVIEKPTRQQTNSESHWVEKPVRRKED